MRLKGKIWIIKAKYISQSPILTCSKTERCEIMKKVLVIGGGAREHVIADAASKSGGEIYAFMKNKNPGIAKLSKEFKLGEVTACESIINFAEKKKIDLAIVGPEGALEAGVINALSENEIKGMGPTKEAALIEPSKEYMRNLMKKNNLHCTLEYKVLDNIEDIKRFLADYDKDVVVKPVGLTGGKGVKIMGEQLKDKSEVLNYCKQIIEKRIGGGIVVLEERAIGQELTIQAFCDGKDAFPMPAVQDHPHAFEGDIGPITGGMGSYSQADGLLPFLSKKDYLEGVETMRKVIKTMAKDAPYKGILYGQFILTNSGLKVVEFNARFGDPEAMNILPLLRTDFLEICEGIACGNLSQKLVSFEKLASVCKYVVPKGYGEKSIAGKRIWVDEDRIKNAGARVFYSSVNERDGEIFTTSSRACAVVGFGGEIAEAEKICEEGLKYVDGEEIYVRHDIGTKESLRKRMKS